MEDKRLLNEEELDNVVGGNGTSEEYGTFFLDSPNAKAPDELLNQVADDSNPNLVEAIGTIDLKDKGIADMIK